MNLLSHSEIQTFRLQGLTHQTLASLASGTYTLEVWRETLASGATTPWYRYGCETALIVHRGHGEYRTPGHSEAFGPGSTLVVVSDALHQLANVGDEPLEFLAVLGMTPVAVSDADGNPVRLPWEIADNQPCPAGCMP